MKIIQSFFCLLAIPVLSILYVGLMASALISILAGILRTFGLDKIEMSIWQDVNIPVPLSIPFSLIVSILLFFSSLYVKRSMTFCISKLRY